MSRLFATVRIDLVRILGRLRHPAAQHLARTATTPAEWRVVAADLETRLTTHDQHLASKAQDAADALAASDIDAAARALAGLRQMSVAEWSEEVVAVAVDGLADAMRAARSPREVDADEADSREASL